MLFRTPQVDITKLDKEHCATDAMAEIRDDSIFARRNEQQEHAHCELRPRQAYWFRCPTCNFDWREWLKPSIIFECLVEYMPKLSRNMFTPVPWNYAQSDNDQSKIRRHARY